MGKEAQTNIFDVLEEAKGTIEEIKEAKAIDQLSNSDLQIVLKDVISGTFHALTPFNRSLIQSEFETFGMSKSFFNSAFSDLKTQHVLGYTPLHARDLVEQEFKKQIEYVTLNRELKSKAVRIKFDTDIDDIHGKQHVEALDLDTMDVSTRAFYAAGGYTDTIKSSDLYVDLVNYNDELKLTFDKKSIELNIQKEISKGISKRKQQIYQNIAFEQYFVKFSGDEFNKVISVLFGKDGQDHTLDIAVLRHFIWQVKKRVIAQNPDNHMMPIFYGKQGGGKTEFIKRFCSILQEGMIDSDFGDFSDERKSRLFIDFPVIFLDELQKANGKDMGEIKGQITTEFIQYKPLYTNDIVTERALSTYIGATNKPVSHQIKDDTGMRRFYEFNVQDILDWDLLATVDWEVIWKSVNEFEPSPIKSVQVDLDKAQEELRNQDPVELWVRDYLDSLNAAQVLSQAVAWKEHFSPYQESNVKYKIDKQEFYNRIGIFGDKVEGVEIKAVNNRAKNIHFTPSETFTHLDYSDVMRAATTPR